MKSTTDIQDYPPHVEAPDIQASDIPNHAPPIKPADNPDCARSIESSDVKPTDTPRRATPVDVVDIQDHAPPIKESKHRVTADPIPARCGAGNLSGRRLLQPVETSRRRPVEEAKAL